MTIWPQHCLIGSNGAKVYEPLHAALVEWEMSEFASVDWVTKGSNFHTEHYGAIKAEVPMPDDDTTQTNTEFAEVMQNSDNVLVAGEASSHCVSRTLTQIAEEFGDDYVRKITLIEDGTSAVEGCEFLYDTFVKEMTTPERGMKIKKFADIF